jgi:hypothetical protein
VDDESPAHTFAKHLAHGGNYGAGSVVAPMSPSAGVGAFIKNIIRNVTTPRTVLAALDAKDVVCIHAVLEKFGPEGLHVQTFFPSLALDLECFDYDLGVVKFLVFQGSNGAFETRMSPRS